MAIKIADEESETEFKDKSVITVPILPFNKSSKYGPELCKVMTRWFKQSLGKLNSFLKFDYFLR